MALRVLLADESVSIKKVMQLALQDFGVEVKSVGNGNDVIAVALGYKPDIFFVDVLLSKRSGYDVCSDLKDNKDLKAIPVVLMWSGFMDMDKQKASSAQADAQLEKPFDADTLRKLVKKLVPRLAQNEVAAFVSYPKLPDFVEDDALSPQDFDEPEEFQQVPLPKVNAGEFKAPAEPEPEGWEHQDLSQYRIKVSSEAEQNDDVLPSMPSDAASIGTNNGSLTFSQQPSIAAALANQNQLQNNTQAQINSQLAEEILKTTAPEVLRELAWKIMPEIVERVVREELQKLLKQAEKFE